MRKGLIEEVRATIDEVDRTHRYSMSKIYGLYNEVFDKKEAPQSCASCLIRKVRELKAWMNGLEQSNESNNEIVSNTTIEDKQVKRRGRKKKN